jgi:hypothetical protein
MWKYGSNTRGKCSLGKLRRRQDNIKILLTDIGGKNVNWSELSQDNIQ